MKNRIMVIFCILIILSLVSSAEEAKPPVKDYKIAGWEWNTFPIIYVEPFDPNDQKKSDSYKGAVKWALDRWVENCAVAWMLDTRDKDNQPNVIVHWVDNYTQLPPPLNQPRYVGAANKNEVWITRKDRNNDDIPWEVAQDIALHEFGHVWGLGHSGEEADVMHDAVVVERKDCKCFAPNKKTLTQRDIDMLNFVFKGFEMDVDYSHDKKNKLIVKYSITSKLGDLKVNGKRYYTLNYETGSYEIPYDVSLKKDNTKRLDYTTETDISTVERLTVGIWIQGATLPNVKNAKFVDAKKYEESFILAEKEGRLLPGPSIPRCSGGYCHSFTNTSIVKGDSFNSFSFIILGICLLTISILTIINIRF